MSDCINVSEIFGKNVFNDTVMREHLPKSVYKKLKKTIEDGADLDSSIADAVAHAMKEWAIERGATHYSHWFQPLTGITAEKQDSFLSAPDSNGKAIMEFSGKELIKGEPDASSFPSGGLRATFEARGYTMWDCTSPAFLKEDAIGVTLCIPTAFCSYKGEALDKKTPLLRSMQAVEEQALRILRLFGNTTAKRVVPSVGPEQEYFLVDHEKYMQRKDLIYAGRTLFGAMPPKGQEMDDHYFGIIRERIGSFMKELNTELWKLGVSAKTQHNEAAPAQHELAPIYAEANVAVDHNQMTMETLKKVAERHGMNCLLHEKPFKGVNGSGKHNNWSLISDDGINLLNPGDTPHENVQFLLVLACILKAVDVHADLLRESAANPGNDQRLGAQEAPPAIISVFLGEQLEDVIDQLCSTGEATHSKTGGTLKTGIKTLPDLYKDATDRNRTSPFAFTGNKFEFRMLGSSNSIACANIMLNAAVAQSLKLYADELERAEDFNTALHELIKRTIKAHKRIIFNGNGYDDAWIREAVEERGLLNLRTTPDAIPELLKKKNIEMLTAHKVYTETELRSRYEIMLENYCKTVCIEAQTMSDMARKQILPAVARYAADVARDAAGKKALDAGISCGYETKLVKKLAAVTERIDTRVDALDSVTARLKTLSDVTEEADFIRDELLSRMTELRAAADEAEILTAESCWPFPTYGDLLFSVK